MATEFHLHVQRILEASVQLQPAARDAMIQRACAGNPKLLEEVQSLLPHFESVRDFKPERLLGTVLKFPGPTTMARTGAECSMEEEPTPFSIDQYKILKVLGEGGMGVVYRGVQFKRRRPVAIKVLRRELTSGEDRHRFALEVEILRKLHHASIAQIIHANIFGTRPYFVMEYIEGRPLTQYARVNRLNVRQKLALISDVCEAVDYAHQRGIIHRDLKPDNILVVDDPSPPSLAGGHPYQVGQPKILDFGIARVMALDSALVQDHCGQFIGTPDYASPEQLAGKIKHLTPRSDVYTLGLITHELLTGRLPQGKNGKPVLALDGVRLDHDQPYSSSWEHEFRYYLGIVLAMALRMNGGKSYRTAGAFGAAIEHLLGRYPEPSAWTRLKFRFRNLVAPRSKWTPSPASRPLRAVLRKRIDMGMQANQYQHQSNSADSSDLDLIRL